MSRADVLIMAEDPGAANFLAPLPAALGASGITASFVANVRLSEFLERNGVRFETLDPACTAERLLSSCRPALLVTGTSEFADCVGLKAIDAARNAAIPSIAVVDMLANAPGRFRGQGNEPLHHAPDWLAVCDNATGRAFEALGYPRDRITVCGHPHFDTVRDRKAQFERETRAEWQQRHYPNAGRRPVIVFVAESVDRVDPAFSERSADYTLNGRGTSDFRTVIVLEELLDAVAEMRPRPYIVVRLHPKNTAVEFVGYRDEIDQFSEGGDPLSVVWAADAVVGMTSMLLVEAYLLGCPTLAILPRAEESDLLVTTANGLTPVAADRQTLRGKLSAILNSPVRTACAEKPDLLPVGALPQLTKFIAARRRDLPGGHP